MGNNRALMRTSRTLMGNFEGINGETLGHCLENSMTLMGISKTLMGISRALMGNFQDINGEILGH